MKTSTHTKKTCQSCRHWSAPQWPEEGAYGICVGINHKETVGQQLKNMTEAAYCVPMGEAKDDESQWAGLHTRPMFGCILHEHGKCDV